MSQQIDMKNPEHAAKYAMEMLGRVTVPGASLVESYNLVIAIDTLATLAKPAEKKVKGEKG